MTGDDTQLRQAQRRLYDLPAEQVSDADLLLVLEARYATEPVPPCRVCGGKLSIQCAGGGQATVHACDGKEEDPEQPGRLRYKPGRSLVDEHYSQSHWTHYQSGDSDVRELITRYRRQSGGDA